MLTSLAMQGELVRERLAVYRNSKQILPEKTGRHMESTERMLTRSPTLKHIQVHAGKKRYLNAKA